MAGCGRGRHAAGGGAGRATTNTWRIGPEAKDGRWVLADIGGGWQVACRIAVQGNELVIAELRVETAGDQAPIDGIRSRQVSAIGIRGAVAAVKDDPALRSSLFREAAEPETAQAYVHSRKRRDRVPKLAAITLAYDRAVRDGRRDVTRAVVEATGLRYATAAHYIHAARSHDPPLLTGGGYGRSGGEATEEARRIAAGWWVAFAKHPATATASAHNARFVVGERP